MAPNDKPNLVRALNDLAPKPKTPTSTRILNSWIAQAQERLGSAGPRLGWLVAATVVSAALQRVVDENGSALFLLKGGTMLQYRLPGMSRTTQDIDGLICGDIERFLTELDDALDQPWGPLTLVRGEVTVIEVPHKIAKPRRFDITAQLNGITWRRVKVEVSPDEGRAGAAPEQIPSPSLAGFGLPTPDHLTSLSMSYQIAQKIHAASDPHKPPTHRNDRARDVVDLLLLRDLVTTTKQPRPTEIRAAIEDIFAARAAEAEATGARPRTWPATLTAYPHWELAFTEAAKSAGLTTELPEAITAINIWLNHLRRT